MEEEKVDKGDPTDMENSQEVGMAPMEHSKDVNGNLGISSGFEGSGEHRKHLPPSKNLKSQCIICKKYIVKQNMKDHARTVHKTTEAKVLGHKSVLEMFAPRPQVPRPAAGGGDDPGGKPGVTDCVGDLRSIQDDIQNISARVGKDDVDQLQLEP